MIIIIAIFILLYFFDYNDEYILRQTRKMLTIIYGIAILVCAFYGIGALLQNLINHSKGNPFYNLALDIVLISAAVEESIAYFWMRYYLKKKADYRQRMDAEKFEAEEKYKLEEAQKREKTIQELNNEIARLSLENQQLKEEFDIGNKELKKPKAKKKSE